MFKALLKKQFMELNTFYFLDKKTGKRRSKGGVAGYIVLMGFVFLSVAILFFGISASLAGVLLAAELDWLYFALMGMIAIALGTFGSAFNTYAGLYHAKDNEMLLSMPIPPVKLLIVRMTGVYAMSLLYSALVWLPALLQYLAQGAATLASAGLGLLLTFVIAAFVSVLSCVLGWVVALISGKLKNKSIITVLLTLVFLGAYYVIYFRMNELLEALLLNPGQTAQNIRTWIYPVYQMGRGAAGELLPMLIFTAITAALCCLCVWVLGKTFTGIVTSEKGVKKAVYREKTAKAADMRSALLRKELRRFLGSPTYMLNCGLGIVILIAAAIFFLFRRDLISGLMNALGEQAPMVLEVVPALAVVAACLGISMNPVTTPSISLEGKYLWVIQSLPVPAIQILNAKLRLHIYLNIFPALFFTAALGILTGSGSLTLIMMLLASVVFVCLTGVAGLTLDLNRPNLTWTNETVAVKQSVSAVIMIFGAWLVAIIIGGGAFAVMKFMDMWLYLLLVSVVLGAVTLLLYRRLETAGAEKFAEL